MIFPQKYGYKYLARKTQWAKNVYMNGCMITSKAKSKGKNKVSRN